MQGYTWYEFEVKPFLDDVYIVSFLSLKSMKNSPNSRNIFHLFELDPAPILFQKLQLQPF